MAQFIVNLNASMPASDKFILHMLDPTHMFVQPHVADMIRRWDFEHNWRRETDGNAGLVSAECLNFFNSPEQMGKATIVGPGSKAAHITWS
uniref:General transcription and DNA repair factor IIH subunit TFB5 n=1 Tax=Oryza meridionalis TaxID=40149 RepID=A0A0E0DKY8_9ORYZ